MATCVSPLKMNSLYSLNTFILAAGLGLRARPLSLVRPKPLFPLGGVPLIRLLVKQLQIEGVRNTYINLHYKGNEIQETLKSHTEIHYLREKHLSGSRILRKALDSGNDPLLVVNGDVFLEIPVLQLLRTFNETHCDGVLLVRRRLSSEYNEVTTDADRFSGTRSHPGPGGLMYCGVALFSQKMVAAIHDESFFLSLKKSTMNVRTLEYTGIWLDLGTPHHYFEAQFAYLKSKGLPPDAAISPESQVSSSSRLDHCIVWDSAKISGSSRLRNVIVTDGVHLSDAVASNRIITGNGHFPISFG